MVVHLTITRNIVEIPIKIINRATHRSIVFANDLNNTVSEVMMVYNRIQINSHFDRVKGVVDIKSIGFSIISISISKPKKNKTIDMIVDALNGTQIFVHR